MNRTPPTSPTTPDDARPSNVARPYRQGSAPSASAIVEAASAFRDCARHDADLCCPAQRTGSSRNICDSILPDATPGRNLQEALKYITTGPAAGAVIRCRRSAPAGRRPAGFKYPALHRDVVVHRPVPIQAILGDIEYGRHRWAERVDGLQLKGVTSSDIRSRGCVGRPPP